MTDDDNEYLSDSSDGQDSHLENTSNHDSDSQNDDGTDLFSDNINLIIPINFFETFAKLSHQNTVSTINGIETLAFLFGEKNENIQQVSDMLLMDQFGNHSSVEPTEHGNVQIGNFKDEHPNLTLLGWSHTHPRYMGLKKVLGTKIILVLKGL